MRASVLAVCATSEAGGAELALLRLLRRVDWDVLVTTPARGAIARHKEFAWAPLALGGLERGAGARAVASWPRARRYARPRDVTYLNGGVPGRLLPALYGIRTVLHIHDIVERVPRHWRTADVVLADSQAVADALARAPGGGAPLQAHVVYCPVELDPPHAPPPWEPDGRPVVGFVGRIEPRKGPLDLVRGAPAIRAARPDARIVIVGDDVLDADPGYVESVRTAAGVEHFGWVADGPALMRHLDVLVVPSRQEPFGTVCSEAMAVGTPVVATRVGGLAEVVDDGLTGRLVAPDRPDELAAAVLEVLADAPRMGAAARIAARRFDADAYAERVADLVLGRERIAA